MPDRLTLPPRASPFTADEPDGNQQDRPAPAPGVRQPQELQNRFLSDLVNKTVTVYLVNGIRLSGTLKQYDAFTVRLHDANDIGTLIFKHAISTLVPGAPAVPTQRRTPFGKLAEWKR